MFKGLSFKSWMKQAGIVKKLQLFLLISIISNIFLVQQIIAIKNPSKKEIEQEKTVTEITSTETTDLISETELRGFTENYIKNFFMITEDAMIFVAGHSKDSLFTSTIEPEMLSRQKMTIQSEFKFSDLYLESISQNQAKAICIGQEIFNNGDYQDRNFTIELVINTENLKVEAIPVFQIEV